MILNVDNPGILADMIAENPSFSIQERQELLETLDVKERLKRVTVLLTREKGILELSRKIQSQVQSEMDKSQREYYLREQLKRSRKNWAKAISKRLKIGELRKRIQDTKMSDEVRKASEKELDRLAKMHPSAANIPFPARIWIGSLTFLEISTGR